jgi:hypothetical protein
VIYLIIYLIRSITTFSTLATASSLYPLRAVSRGTTVQVSPPTPTPTSFAAHLLLQPPGPRQLLQKFDQHVSDTCMIEHLRSIKSKTISTDGSLSIIGQGTVGWMLTDAQGKKLITGSGPVDGPADQASSTRSELHGFAAPLKYIHQLASPSSYHIICSTSGMPMTRWMVATFRSV